MPLKNIFYAQSGGPTAVINATAAAVIETARQHDHQIGTVFAGKNGIVGALKEELIDTQFESADDLKALHHTPGAAFGSCRFKLDGEDATCKRLIDVFAAHDIGYFFYNGGGDSQDTCYKISLMSQHMNYPLTCIGLPKTIDNDLAFTDTSPGFGSAAKYIATSTLEASLDLASMCATSTQVFIFETMGRHSGWLAASAGLAQRQPTDPPHIILVPEISFNQQDFLAKVKLSIQQQGFCVVVSSEGIKDRSQRYLSEATTTDAFGHTQLGGVAPMLAHLITHQLGYKCHWALSDYLQRSARHIASQTDYEQAYAVGQAAVNYALKDINNVMLTIERKPTADYQWYIGHAPLKKVANVEKKLPRDFMDSEGYAITTQCRNYLSPLLAGEAYPHYLNGLPNYIRLKNQLTPKKLASDNW